MSEPVDPRKLDACGCCDAGLGEPEHANPPGLPEVRYRIGTHPDFLARMKARIHSWEVLTCAGCDARFAGPDRLARALEHVAQAHPEAPDPAALVVARRPLAELGSRAPDDPAVALMDAWAVAGDVLTFYQERIANESWLRTATERRSILELARAIGYELDPGVAAETYLAFTVDDAEGAPGKARVAAGTQVLSVPSSQDEPPQTFETAEGLEARVEWNALRPRLAHPPTLTSGVSHLYLEGTATGVKAGRPLLLLLGGTPVVRRAMAVSPDPDAGHTRVDLAGGTTEPSTTLSAHPAGELDPDGEPLELTRANVDAHVVRKTWTESDLQAFLTTNGWDVDRVLAYVADLRAATFEDPERRLLAFRESLGFFGHNAPLFDSLPDREDDGGETVRSLRAGAGAGPPEVVEALGEAEGVLGIDEAARPLSSAGSGKAWPVDWDRSGGFPIWKDSLTDGWYDEGDAPFDVYLERPLEGLAGDTWAVFERPVGEHAVYRVVDAGEASRTGFGMSAKLHGLELARADRAPLGNDGTDKPSAFRVRLSTAHVRGEVLDLAPLPLAEALAEGTEEIVLGTMTLGLRAGRVVILRGEEVGSDGALRAELVTLDAVSHAGGHTTLTLEEGLARSYVRDTVTVNANVVLASHGETVGDEVLGSGDGAAEHQRFTLARPPLTYRSAVGGSESELTVRVDGVAWERADSLYGLDGGRRAFVVRISDDARATVVFGDGRGGARLPTGRENVTATYRSGSGSVGEVGADTLTLLRTRPFGVRSVSNPLPASGADDPESLDDARGNAPLTVLTLDRIVSLRDYEDYARAYPGIGKARADAVWNGEGEVVHVTVADANGDPVVDPLHGRLLESIERARDPLRPVVLASYQPFLFFVTAAVIRDEAHRWEDVEAALGVALTNAFGFASRGFAQPVTAAEVLHVMHGVDGVVAVDLDELYRTAPGTAPSGSTCNTVLPARRARFDGDAGKVLPAELLLVHELGIALSEKTP